MHLKTKMRPLFSDELLQNEDEFLYLSGKCRGLSACRVTTIAPASNTPKLKFPIQDAAGGVSCLLQMRPQNLVLSQNKISCPGYCKGTEILMTNAPFDKSAKTKIRKALIWPSGLLQIFQELCKWKRPKREDKCAFNNNAETKPY